MEIFKYYSQAVFIITISLVIANPCYSQTPLAKVSSSPSISVPTISPTVFPTTAPTVVATALVVPTSTISSEPISFQINSTSELLSFISLLSAPSARAKDFLAELLTNMSTRNVSGYNFVFSNTSSAEARIMNIRYKDLVLESVQQQTPYCLSSINLTGLNITPEMEQSYPRLSNLAKKGHLCLVLSTMRSMFLILKLPTPEGTPFAVTRPGSKTPVFNPDIVEEQLAKLHLPPESNDGLWTEQANELYETYNVKGKYGYSVTCDKNTYRGATFAALKTIPDSQTEANLKTRCEDLKRKRDEEQDCRLHTEWKERDVGHDEMITDVTWDAKRKCCVVTTIDGWLKQTLGGVDLPIMPDKYNKSSACVKSLSENYSKAGAGPNVKVNVDGFWAFCCKKNFEYDEGED